MLVTETTFPRNSVSRFTTNLALLVAADHRDRDRPRPRPRLQPRPRSDRDRDRDRPRPRPRPPRPRLQRRRLDRTIESPRSSREHILSPAVRPPRRAHPLPQAPGRLRRASALAVRRGHDVHARQDVPPPRRATNTRALATTKSTSPRARRCDRESSPSCSHAARSQRRTG